MRNKSLANQLKASVVSKRNARREVLSVERVAHVQITKVSRNLQGVGWNEVRGETNDRVFFTWVPKVISCWLWLSFTTVCDWWAKFAPLSQPMARTRFPALGAGDILFVSSSDRSTVPLLCTWWRVILFSIENRLKCCILFLAFLQP